MKIEDEIKQNKKFTSEYHKLAVNIIFTSSWLYRTHAQSLKSFGISPEQFNVLRILRGQHPNCANNQLISERMIDKSSNSSRIVEKLKQKGFVDRKENKNDRRHVDISITKKGLDLLENIDAKSSEMDALKSSVTVKEAQVINDLLDKLRG
ncbi:MAG: MarR family transcriptional regulator [Bacteroidetes bacterium]|nr:MarR family transcriptional regulator [Bacteroidota bacterium]